MFPYEKYRYFSNNKDLVIAEQTYAGKKSRGAAKLGESDSFDLESGKDLAAARCDVKICRQRYMQAKEKYSSINSLINILCELAKDAGAYYYDSLEELNNAKERLEKIELDLGLTKEAKEEWLKREK